MDHYEWQDIEYVVTTLKFSDLTEEQVTARMDFCGRECKISVYNNEGDRIPHFHLETVGSVNKKQKLDCCICINEPRYFIHGKHTDTLTDSEAEELYNILKGKSDIDGFKDKSVWDMIKASWIIANGREYVFRKRVPKYSDINRYDPIHGK